MKYTKQCSYEEYLSWQKKKTQSETTRMKFFHNKKRFQRMVDAFANRIKLIGLTKGSTILCSGARYGQENTAAKNLGLIPTAFDLVPCPEYEVVEGDFHNLKYKDNSFDCYFSTSIDHSNNIPKFLSEANRVTKRHGLMVIGIWDSRPGDYEAVSFKNPEDLILEVNRDDNWELVSITVIPNEAKLFSKGKEYQIIFKNIKE